MRCVVLALVFLTGCAATQKALDAIDTVAALDPMLAFARLTDLAKVSGIAWIWNGLHATLDFISGVSSQQWVLYAQGSVRSAVAGCRAGLG